MQKYSRYHYNVEPFTEDYCGNLSWGNLGNLLLRCASLHAGEHKFGYIQMMEWKRVWVLSRLVIEMDRLPRTAEDFTVETWVDRVYRQFTDRHFTIWDGEGKPFGHATSIWALIDIENRLPADLTKLPDGGFTRVMIPERPSPVKPMGRMRMRQPRLLATRKATYSDLDINGHVNSIKYIEMLIDCVGLEEMKAHPIRRIEMAYCLESYYGDTLDIYVDEAENAPGHRQYEIRKGDEIIVKGCLIQRVEEPAEAGV